MMNRTDSKSLGETPGPLTGLRVVKRRAASPAPTAPSCWRIWGLRC